MKPAGTEHEVVQIGQVARHEKAPRSDRRGLSVPLVPAMDGSTIRRRGSVAWAGHLPYAHAPELLITWRRL
jgi:hypothetical protein